MAHADATVLKSTKRSSGGEMKGQNFTSEAVRKAGIAAQNPSSKRKRPQEADAEQSAQIHRQANVTAIKTAAQNQLSSRTGKNERSQGNEREQITQRAPAEGPFAAQAIAQENVDVDDDEDEDDEGDKDQNGDDDNISSNAIRPSGVMSAGPLVATHGASQPNTNLTLNWVNHPSELSHYSNGDASGVGMHSNLMRRLGQAVPASAGIRRQENTIDDGFRFGLDHAAAAMEEAMSQGRYGSGMQGYGRHANRMQGCGNAIAPNGSGDVWMGAEVPTMDYFYVDAAGARGEIRGGAQAYVGSGVQGYAVNYGIAASPVPDHVLAGLDPGPPFATEPLMTDQEMQDMVDSWEPTDG